MTRGAHSRPGPVSAVPKSHLAAAQPNGSLAFTIVAFVSAAVLPAQSTRTVCEALMDLTDLNGKDVKIRGVFGAGHTGQELFASPPCAQPTIRDGWVWRDFISVWPANKIMATLVGRLETRDHFDVRIFQDGRQVPDAYRWFVAHLLYRVIDHFEAVPEGPQEIAQEAESRRRPYAVRAEPAKHY
jgi:hypothetical protein